MARIPFRCAIVAAVVVMTCAHAAGAAGAAPPPPLPNDTGPKNLSLPESASAHWVWVNDVAFPHMPDSKAMLVDGDSGRFLGELNTGFANNHIVLSGDGKVIYSPETYFSRGVRGTRSDVVTLYDPSHLSVIGEIGIPAKLSSNMPMMGNAQLTDDGRFLLLYNFTPAQSVTVIDTRSRTFVGEVDTAGCALIFPTGPRSFFSLCADGSLLNVRLDESGHKAGDDRTDPLIDVDKDPVTEKGVRLGDTWYFVSFGGTLYPVRSVGGKLKLDPTWSLLSAAEKSQDWRPGGLQQLAVHAGSRRLYSIMHQGPLATHKEPGREVWVYDLARRTRIGKIELKSDAASIQVSRDAHPLLFCVFMGSNVLEIYDAVSGNFLRSVGEIGTTPTLLQTP